MSRPALLDLQQLELAAPLIRTAAHPIRLRIIDLLSGGEACVGDIALAAEVPQAIASQHLATLRQAGILSCTRDGQRVFYRLVRVELIKLLDCIRDHCQLHQSE
jgi:ArsR family transcriptional regulator